MIDKAKHKAVIDNQKSVADKAGKRIGSEIVRLVPLKQVMVVALRQDRKLRKNFAQQLSHMLLGQFIRSINDPTNLTLKIGGDFAQEKLSAVQT